MTKDQGRSYALHDTFAITDIHLIDNIDPAGVVMDSANGTHSLLNTWVHIWI
jgi:hypothetical protein